MTIMGAPHFGQSQRSLESLLPDRSCLSAAVNQADESKVAGAWRDAGWQGIRSSECGRSLSEAGEEEAAQELIDRESHQLLFVVVSGVAPAKGDLSFGKREQAMIGDGYAMGVAAQILKHILRAAEGWFRVHHPVLTE